MNTEKNTVFAAANTAEGFVSCFESVFSPGVWKKIWILKGGPGTGKSSFLRKVGKEAEKRGEEVHYFACSSDPNSLDGVTLPERGTALLDGTAPHSADPVYPGAVEEILNMGMFFDAKALAEHLREIRSLSESYRAAQRNASRFLAAAGYVRKTELAYIGDTLDKEKLAKAASNAVKGFPQEKEFREETLFLSAFGKKGLVRLDGCPAENRIFVSDRKRTASLYLDALCEAARMRGASFVRYPDPLCPEETEGIFFPSVGTAFLSDRYGGEGRRILPDRFIDPKLFADSRAKFRFSVRCREALCEGACETLAEAGKLHDDLEKIYIAAMDFRAKEAYTRRFLKKLFSE